jgi:hypothetical protein
MEAEVKSIKGYLLDRLPETSTKQEEDISPNAKDTKD